MTKDAITGEFYLSRKEILIIISMLIVLLCIIGYFVLW